MRRQTRAVSIAVVAALIAGCGSATSSPTRTDARSTPPSTSASALTSAATSEAPPSPTVSRAFGELVASDLDVVDETVRAKHPDPWANHPEAAWTAKLTELRASLPTAKPDEALVQLQSLVALLDTHSALFLPPGDSFPMVTHRFAEGFYITAARDPSLVGARIDAIEGTPVATVEAKLRPLIAADNDSAILDAINLSGIDPEGDRRMGSPNVLHGLGIIPDPARATFTVTRSDGKRSDVALEAAPNQQLYDEFQVTGGLNGSAPRAVARRNDAVWTFVDTKTHAFLFSVNDMHKDGIPAALAAMTSALDDGSVNRVILDLRYARGGSSRDMDGMVAGLAADKRVNRRGGLLVLIGREDVSASTTVIAKIDDRTDAVFFGEATPARADNFLNPEAFDLPGSGWKLWIPTFSWHTGDPRQAIDPDVAIATTAADFFAGRDATLSAALAYRP